MATPKRSTSKAEGSPQITPMPFPGESPTVSLALAAGRMYGLNDDEDQGETSRGSRPKRKASGQRKAAAPRKKAASGKKAASRKKATSGKKPATSAKKPARKKAAGRKKPAR
jgi:hypothetical protein